MRLSKAVFRAGKQMKRGNNFVMVRVFFVLSNGHETRGTYHNMN